MIIRLVSRRRGLLIAASILGYLLLAIWMPLPLNVLIPADVRSFSPSLPAGLAYVGLIAVLHGCYWWLARPLLDGRWRPALPAILGLAFLFALPTIFTYPVNANDLYRYALRGRITAIHGQNPFLAPPAAFPEETLLPLAGEWAESTTPYGPVWEIMAAGVAFLGGERPVPLLLAYKLLAIGAHLAVAAALWRALAGRPPAERRWLTALWAWNPALLLIFGVDGHNDVVMLLWLVLGWLALDSALRRRSVPLSAAAFGIMTLAPLTKAIGLLAIPIYGLYALRQFPRPEERLRLVIVSALTGLALAVLAFLPFGSPLQLVERLVSEAAAGASFSPLTLLFLLAGEVGIERQLVDLSAMFVSGMVVAFLTTLWFVWRGSSPHRATAGLLAVYVFLAFNFRIWYPAWLLPFLLLAPEKRPALRAGLWFLFLAQGSVFIYSHLWAYLLEQNDFLAHLIGVGVVFGGTAFVWGRGGGGDR